MVEEEYRSTGVQEFKEFKGFEDGKRHSYSALSPLRSPQIVPETA